MRIFLSVFFILCSRFVALSQPATIVGNQSPLVLHHFQTLPNQGYSFKQMLTDTALPFVTDDSLRLVATNSYWLKLKLKNNSNYARPYLLKVLPNINNTLFYFDEDANQWTSHTAGLMVNTDRSRAKGLLLITLQGGKATTLYLLMNNGKNLSVTKPIKPQLILEQQEQVARKENWLALACIVSLVVLLISFIHNLHVYLSFQDRAVLYFLVAQLGGMLYIITYRSFFNVVCFSPPFSLSVQANGFVSFYDWNTVLMHISVALILFGFVQFTRSYLHSKKQLPGLDAILKYSLAGYLVFTAVAMLINVFCTYIDGYTLLYDNVLVMALILAILCTSVAGYRQQLPSAKAFLYANMVPLLLMMCLTLYHVFINFRNDGKTILPDLAIISQALCFSIAIVPRIKTMRLSMALKEAEAQQLAFDIREMNLKHQEIVLEKEHINASLRDLELRKQQQEQEARQLSEWILQEKNTNKSLQEKLETNSRELASNTLYLVQKNEMLAKLKKQIEELNKLNPGSKNGELAGIASTLQNNLYLDEDWNKFRLHFEQVHPNFFAEIVAKYPTLTKNELRLYSYFHINLSTKEIAALLNIDPASVRRAKTRLYKKIGRSESKETLEELDTVLSNDSQKSDS